jgi:hypothetical protein
MESTPTRKRRQRPVDGADYFRMLRRLLRSAGHRVADADVEDLAELISLRSELDTAILVAVKGLRDSGATWEDIGGATGTTRQAAIMKWSARVAAAAEEAAQRVS